LASVIAVCKSDTKGISKAPVASAVFKVGVGLEGDAHAGGDAVREVSLLAVESIGKMKSDGREFKPGDFAENITTSGIELEGRQRSDAGGHADRQEMPQRVRHF
jgi:MOSC domain-containing protein YiiM